MEEKIQKAFEVANYMSTLAAQKKIFKEEYHQNLVHYHNGGTFKVTRELINFVETLVLKGHEANVILIDDNDLPIEIADLKKFSEEIVSRYFESVNEYYSKYSRLKKNRSIKGLLDL